MFLYVCVLLDCSDVSIDNGTASMPTGTTYGEIAFMSCDSGFVIMGETYIVCNASGSWSSVTTCLRGMYFVYFHCRLIVHAF